MKNKLFKIILILYIAFITSVLSAQTVILHTPNGSTVEAFTSQEMTSSQISYYTNQYKNTFPQAEVIKDASAKYNCHSYAWNISEGKSTVCWLNQYPDLHKYWDDLSYIETSEQNGEKIFYYAGDHSAIKSKSVSGKYESKWGAMPLMRHSPSYGPSFYKMEQRKYYTKPTIAGSSTICTSNTIFTLNIPNSTITWSTTPNITIVSGQGTNNLTVKGNGNGNGTITATISQNGSNPIPISKNIWVGVPEIINTNILGENQFCQSNGYLNQNNVKIDILGGDANTEMKINKRTNNFHYTTMGNSVCIKPYNLGNIFFTVQVNNQCGWSENAGYQYEVIDCNNNNYIRAYPNPARNNVNIELSELSTNKNSERSAQTKSNSCPIITITNQFGLVVYRNDFNDDNTSINISNLNKGLYTVTVIKGDKKYSSKLIKE